MTNFPQVPARTRDRTSIHFQLRGAIAFAALYMLLAALAPAASYACACGCGIFDVGTESMFPHHAGLMAFLEYDFMDQNRNWSGSSSAPADNNADKRIKTDFYTAGLEYQFDRSWGLQVEVPYWNRTFRTTDDSGDVVQNTHAALGDIRLKGVYTGYSDDMSTGLTFGLKLPTGDSTYANFDPDTEIGTGSTDLLLGAYHLGTLTADGQWGYFTQVQWDAPLHSKSQYRPGSEVDASIGAYYHGWTPSANVRIAPVLQLTATYRAHDGGALANPGDSGYTRLLVTPGVQLDIRQLSVYVDVGLPLYRNASGNQLVSDQFWRVNLSYHF